MEIPNPEHLVLELVRKVRADFDEDFSKEEMAKNICRRYGVEIVEGPLPLNMDGKYSRELKKITLNSDIDHKQRRLFTMFHETLHLLIEQEGEEIIEVLNEYARTSFQDAVEPLCDLGASEFLLPTEEVLSGDMSVDIKLYQHLVKTHEEASAPAIARKLAYLAPYEAIFVICRELYQSSGEGGLFQCEQKSSKELSIEYAFNTKKFKYRLKRFHPVPSQHMIKNSFGNPSIANGEDRFPFANPKTKMPCYVECFTEGKRIFGILHSKRPVNNEDQLGLGI